MVEKWQKYINFFFFLPVLEIRNSLIKLLEIHMFLKNNFFNKITLKYILPLFVA